MKTLVLLEGGYTQLVLTPENPFEKDWIKALRGKKYTSRQYVGHYHCQGGWTREGETMDSLMFIFEEEK
uniref:Uncharacterized protein n=1 Tax=viral metagenome TaxID=1070528 RepID=A0A6M3L817_9ZZZZ